MVKQRLAMTLWGALAACSVSSAHNSGGVHVDGGSVDAGDGGGAVCPSALVVASSDYTSTNISVLSAAGAILSESIVSSASAPPGLTTALSGDVVLPLAPTPGKIVLIDRYPNSVVSWVDPSTGAVTHQLPVGTGFAANPHDYLEVSRTKAYVSRHESNANAGQQPNDGGGDLLIIDPEAVAITGRVPFAPDGALLPRPDRMMRVGGEVWVSLLRFDADFKTVGDARLVGVSTTDDSIAWTLDLPGVANCGGIAMAPAGKVVALACGGGLGDADPTQRSAVVLVDASAHPPVELKRFAVAAQLGAPLDPALAYASDGLLVGAVLGDTKAGRNDLAYALDLVSGTARVLADAGAAFAFSDVHCAPGCDDLCFLTDANANALRVWKANGTLLSPQASVPVDPSIGLAPRAIGSF
jgi:hypothetical protein